MLRALCDETASHKGKRITGVAAVLFDDSGYETFRAEWAPQLASLKKQYSMAHCYWGYEEFAKPPWNEQSRRALWQTLGRLIVRTRIASFVSFITDDDYQEHVKNQPNYEKRIGNPYNFCLMHCALQVSKFAKKQGAGNVAYTFESGGPKMEDASAFMNRVARNEKVSADLSYGGHAFLSKSNEPALYAPDYIAWGWQRSFSPGGNEWHETLKIILDDKSRPLYAGRMHEGDVAEHLIYNFFYSLRGD